MPPKRQRWTPGAIVRIPLGNELHSYAQMLDDGEYAFFDLQTTGDVTPEEVGSHDVIFRLWVMRYAHSSGRWPKVGKAERSPSLRLAVLRFNQNMLNLDDIRLTYDGCDGSLAEFKDCEGLECAAVWDPEHVEERLRDHFHGRPNMWVLSLRPRDPAFSE